MQVALSERKKHCWLVCVGLYQAEAERGYRGKEEEMDFKWEEGGESMKKREEALGSPWPLFSMHTHCWDDSGGRRRPLFLSDLPLH